MTSHHHFRQPWVSCVGIGSMVLAVSAASCAGSSESDHHGEGVDVDPSAADLEEESETIAESEEESGNPKVGLIAFENTYGIKLEGGGGAEHASIAGRFSDVGWLGHEPDSPGSGHVSWKCDHKKVSRACSSFQCAQSETPPPPVFAGEITISRGGVQPPFNLFFDPDWPFYLGKPEGHLFRAGYDLGVHSTGSANVPAFEAHVRAPDELIITSPVSPPTPSDGGIPVFELDRWKPAKFVWTSPTRGNVRVEIYHRAQGRLEAESGIRCDFPASAKRGTIPLFVLRRVNQRQAWIQVRGHEETTVRAGEYDVRVMAAGEGKSPEGYLFPRDFNWK